MNINSIYYEKNVIIIGPAPHIVESEIDVSQYDVVVRINDAIPIPQEVKDTTGKRCDVLYIWRQIRLNSNMSGVREIRLKPDAIWQIDWIRENHYRFKEKVAIIHPRFFYDLQAKLGSRPNTGLVAIADIISQHPKKLHIAGITFYQEGGYYNGYVSEVRNDKITKLKGNFAKHRQDPQIKFFYNNFYKLPNVECDDKLKQIIKEKYGD
jgi:hypothetical protein